MTIINKSIVVLFVSVIIFFSLVTSQTECQLDCPNTIPNLPNPNPSCDDGFENSCLEMGFVGCSQNECCTDFCDGDFCCKSGKCCGDSCCSTGETCCNGVCCSAGGTCCDGKCCSFGKSCWIWFCI